MSKSTREQVDVDKYFEALTVVVDAVTGNELLVQITGAKLATLTDALLELEAVRKENAVLKSKEPIILEGCRRSAIRMINTERDRQESKWGEQNHDLPVWMGILGEEYGELCQAVNETVFDNGPEERQKGGYENVMKEACQVAAVAVSIMECLERNRAQWGM